MIRRFIQACFRRLGLKLIRDPGPPENDSALPRLRDAGLVPRTVVDVGAAFGDWSMACANVFPDAQFVLFEPVEEYRPILEPQVARLNHATLLVAAASNFSGTTAINVHHDFLVGSSLLNETEAGDIDGAPREVTAWRLDDVAESKSLQAPFFLKIDVQGAELRVLEGAEHVLSSSLGIIVEVSFLPFFTGGPEFARVISHMGERGFVVYDISGLRRRPLDGALAQADISFVREDSPVRQVHGYASPEQRQALNAMFQSLFAKRRAESQRKS